MSAKFVQLVWLVVVIALLLALWMVSGLSRQGLGAEVSLLILFALPVIGVLWIIRRLGRGFALVPSHWLVPVALVPVAWFGLQTFALVEG